MSDSKKATIAKGANVRWLAQRWALPRRVALVLMSLLCASLGLAALSPPLMADAFRSTTVVFVNSTDRTLTKLRQDRPHGIWGTRVGGADADPPPPAAGRRPAATTAWRDIETLVLPNHVTLQLFVGCPTYRLRYVRSAEDGQVLTDVMLQPSQEAPK
jgi:hypothetical protein